MIRVVRHGSGSLLFTHPGSRGQKATGSATLLIDRSLIYCLAMLRRGSNIRPHGKNAVCMDPYQLKGRIRIKMIADQDQDPNEIADDKPTCMDVSLFEHFFKVFEPLFGS
jgi:hypothetical protein